MDNSPLFTIIIPCKNRAEYLRHTLKTCSIQDYEPLAVIVCDDGSTDITRGVVEEAMRLDRNIRYFSHKPGIGMRDNFEHALQQVKSGYVIALGGDDGLLPGGIKGMAEILKETGKDLLSWPAPVYTYAGVRGSKGQLAIYHEKGLKIVDSSEFLARQAGALHYLSDIESPMFYVKGVSSINLINKVRNRSRDGRFFSCPTPDGYSGIVLAGEVESFAFSAKPFSIYGLSPSSQGMAYLSNEKNAKKISEEFFESVSLTPMHEELAFQPYSPLITLMTADYLLTAMDLPGWPGKVPPIDFRKVLQNGIIELQHGLYGGERLNRELNILYIIAEKHGLGSFFRDKVRCTKRYREKDLFHGNGINGNSIIFDAQVLDVGNIFDASYAAQLLYNIYSQLSWTSCFKMIGEMIKYKYNSLARGMPFPNESEWLNIS